VKDREGGEDASEGLKVQRRATKMIKECREIIQRKTLNRFNYT